MPDDRPERSRSQPIQQANTSEAAVDSTRARDDHGGAGERLDIRSITAEGAVQFKARPVKSVAVDRDFPPAVLSPAPAG